ncbi:MAG: hypothetical protein CMG66_02585 [Candidatus Marinimicrobia bacterium]|nr:hypothetical protein [Candidatus Neomarinimicrobiota bacterium]|tara:strand:- start:2618 stop:3208 length:591 start_codon:yes stop_codon:yes gene_type:complete
MFLNNVKQLFLFIFVCLIAMSCDNDHGHDDGLHTTPKGFIFEDKDGNTIYEYFEGAVDGEISLDVGDELIYSVHFLDADREEVVHLEGEEHEEYLAFSGYDDNMVSIEQVDTHADEEHCEDLGEVACGLSDHCEWHIADSECEDLGHDTHEMMIKIVGLDYGTGTTSFKLMLMHNDHPDYETKDDTPIIITVEVQD